MKKNYQSVLILVILCVFLCVCLFHADDVTNEFFQYSNLFFKNVFPSSMLFLTISSLLLDYHFIYFLQKIFHKSSAYLYVFLFSLFSGFPSGAFLTKELLEKEIIDVDAANQIIRYAHFPNPLFVITSISLVLGSTMYAILLLISIILSNFIIFLCISKRKIIYSSSISFPTHFLSCFQKNIFHSFRTIILIYSISLSFNLLAFLIQLFFQISISIKVFLSGFFDLTRGVFSIPELSSYYLKIIYLLFFFAFGSLSIQMQTKSILSDTDVCFSNYLIGRIISFFLSTIIFFFLFIINSRCTIGC